MDKPMTDPIELILNYQTKIVELAVQIASLEIERDKRLALTDDELEWLSEVVLEERYRLSFTHAHEHKVLCESVYNKLSKGSITNE